MNRGIRFFNDKVDYPVRYQSKNLAKIVVIQFLLIFITLYFFKPFTVNISEQRWNYLTTCCLHALVPASIVFLYINTLTRFRKSHSASDWTLKKETSHIVIIFLIVGLSGFLLRNVIYTNPDNISWRYLWAEIRNSYVIGIIFCIYLISAKLYFDSAANKLSDNDSSQVILETSIQDLIPAPIFIKAHVRVDDFYFRPQNLLFARAEGNYVTLTMIDNGCLKNELKRISLKQLEEQLAVFPYLLRCHRAYLVNVQRITKFSGNSQGYLVSFDGTEDKIPVSRAYTGVFGQVYKQAEPVS